MTLARTSAQTGTVAAAPVGLVGTWAAGRSFPLHSQYRPGFQARLPTELQSSDRGQVILPPWPQFLRCIKWEWLQSPHPGVVVCGLNEIISIIVTAGHSKHDIRGGSVAVTGQGLNRHAASGPDWLSLDVRIMDD